MPRLGIVRNEAGEINCIFLEPNHEICNRINDEASRCGYSVTYHSPKPAKWVLERLAAATCDELDHPATKF